MNILLIILAIVLVWRVAAGMKKGVVRELIAFVNVLFVVLIVGLLSLGLDAYHGENYLTIVVVVVAAAVLGVLYSILKLVFFPAKVITKLPIISTADRLLGLVIGLAETLICFWGLCSVLGYVELGTLNEQISEMINNSQLLSGLAQHNLLARLLDAIKAKLTF